MSVTLIRPIKTALRMESLAGRQISFFGPKMEPKLVISFYLFKTVQTHVLLIFSDSTRVQTLQRAPGVKMKIKWKRCMCHRMPRLRTLNDNLLSGQIYYRVIHLTRRSRRKRRQIIRCTIAFSYYVSANWFIQVQI